jgi:hypothetical protein
MTQSGHGKKFKLFDEQWQPKVIAEMNDYQFKIVQSPGMAVGVVAEAGMAVAEAGMGALLKDLQPAAISHAYSRLLESGHRKGGGLSAGTVRHVHRLLKQALAQAGTLGRRLGNQSESVRRGETAESLADQDARP